jgi:hypothetical protein
VDFVVVAAAEVEVERLEVPVAAVAVQLEVLVAAVAVQLEVLVVAAVRLEQAYRIWERTNLRAVGLRRVDQLRVDRMSVLRISIGRWRIVQRRHNFRRSIGHLAD